MSQKLLSLEQITNYLSAQGVVYRIEQHDGRRTICMNWDLDMGQVAVLVYVDQETSEATRLELNCVTQKQYTVSQEELIMELNERNRARAFTRYLDQTGHLWLGYVGYYYPQNHLDKNTFDVVLGGVLTLFEDDILYFEQVVDAYQDSQVLT